MGLLTECKNLSKTLDIKAVTDGFPHKGIIKNAIWKEYDRELKALIRSRDKIKDLW